MTAAEHSGDALGAALIAALRRKIPDARFTGVGGPKMAAVGCKLLANPVAGSAMLVSGFIKNSLYWMKLLRLIKRELAATRPSVLIPIDSSAVNLRIAALGRELKIPVCYYVAPQTWASRPWRSKKIAGSVDTLCCILPFEEAYFRPRGINAVYVGHPMFDEPAESLESNPLMLDPPLPGLRQLMEPPTQAGATRPLPFSRIVSSSPDTPPDAPRVALFPGSRKAEINHHMPPMLEIISEIKGRFPRVSFVASAPSEERAWQIRHHLRNANTPIDIRVGSSDAIIRWADLVLTKSGTSVLQIARHGKPMVALFSIHPLAWHLVARHFINTKYITLVNILANRELIPEYIPFYGSPLPIARECIELLSRPDLRQKMSQELLELVAPLHPSDDVLAADRVAEEVIKLLAPKAN